MARDLKIYLEKNGNPKTEIRYIRISDPYDLVSPFNYVARKIRNIFHEDMNDMQLSWQGMFSALNCKNMYRWPSFFICIDCLLSMLTA